MIVSGGQGTTVTAGFSNRDSVQMVHIGNGVWQSTWKPVNPGTVTMFVTAFAVQNGTLVGGRSTTLNRPGDHAGGSYADGDSAGRSARRRQRARRRAHRARRVDLDLWVESLRQHAT